MADSQTTLPATLRQLAQYQGPPTSDKMTEAADEIERLHAMLAEFYTTPQTTLCP